MNRRALLVLALLFPLTACGVKSDLEKPGGQPGQKTEKDPSKPPSPIGK
jgi:predicted small lipoprotein YifL